MTDSASTIKIWRISATKCSFADNYLDGDLRCALAEDQEIAVILADKNTILRNDRIFDQGYRGSVIDGGVEHVIRCPSLAREIDYTTWVQAETACIATEVALDRINSYHAANLPQ